MKVELHNQDNLECLKNIEDKSINLIYSDILFGTGRKFNGFIDLKPIRSEIEKHYIPRFEEMYRVLSDTGTIYIHCDWHISHWIRCLLDDVFGYSQLKNEIIWSYNSAPRRKGCFGNRHDTIFRYTKTDKFTFNEDEVREPYALSAPKEYEKAKYYHPLGKVCGDVFEIPIIAQNDHSRTGYNTEKPEKLLERMIKVSSNVGDTVLDVYMGSGTTGVVACRLNRNFIGCDNSELAFEISQKRLSKYNV